MSDALSALPVGPFTENGYTLQQLMRAGHVAIYRRRKGAQPEHFEVIVIQIQKASEFRPEGKPAITYPARERYPRSAEWGSKGWTFSREADARAKAIELL